MIPPLPALQLQLDVEQLRAWGCVLVCVDGPSAAGLARQCECGRCGLRDILRAHALDPVRVELREYDDGALLVVSTPPTGVLS